MDVPARLGLALLDGLLFVLFEFLGGGFDRVCLLVHLFARLVVELGAAWTAGSDACTDEGEKVILGEGLETVFLDRGELGRAGVVAQDDIGCLGRGLEGDATVGVEDEDVYVRAGCDLPAVSFGEVDGFVAGKGGELAGEDKGETEETVG